jgi:hypothetical protein
VSGVGAQRVAEPTSSTSRSPVGSAIGTLLVDGFYRANWKIAQEGTAATLTVDRFERLPGDSADAIDEIAAEATGLLAFVAPDSAERRVEFVPSP